MNHKKVLIFLSAVVFIVAIGLLIVFYTRGEGEEKDLSNTENGVVAGVSTQNSTQNSEWIEGLAKTLTEKGAVMYGAYWCSHCNNQKRLFGEAVKYIDYVECDPSSEGANPDECKARGIDGYPTWIYNGQHFPGEMSLEKLAQIVGYR